LLCGVEYAGEFQSGEATQYFNQFLNVPGRDVMPVTRSGANASPFAASYQVDNAKQ